MKTNIIFIYFILLSAKFLGQTFPSNYYFFKRQADSLWKLKEYNKAGVAFSSAFKTIGNKGLVEDRYNAARVWSLAGITDSSFDCLKRIINKKYFTNYERLVTEKDFLSIKSDKRWKPIIDTLKKYQGPIYKNFNGQQTFYNEHSQVVKQGIFKKGKLTDGKIFIYTSENNLERVNFYKDGNFQRDSLAN